MKKRYLLLVSLMASNFMGFAQFTANRLVVSQFGDGTAELADKTVPIFLKEYKTTADNTPTYSLAMPIAAGANDSSPLTGLPSAQNEGLITLSPNGQYISLLGYGLTPSKSVADGDMRVVAWVKQDGTYNTTTNVKGTANNLNSPRCAITIDGTYFWVVGSAGGVRYKSTGYTSAGTGTTSISSTASAMRSVAIFNDQLYGITNASAGPRIGSVGEGLPTTTGQTTTALPGFATAPTTPNQVAFLRLATGTGAPDLVYIANDEATEGTIQKWVLDSETSTWVNKGSVTVSTGSTVRLNVKGVTAQINPTTGTAYIYAATPDKIVKITDANAATSTINGTDNAPVTLATAPTNTMFRGVALTPGSSTTLPVKLTSFTGKQQQQTVKLNWTTASEQNNAYFEVLHAADGSNFNALEKVTGNGTSNTPHSYSFVDENPSAGTNYYQLNQVDFNGQSEKSGVIAVKTDLKASTLSVFLSEDNQVQANIYSANTTTAQLSVTDITGRKLASASINLTKGYNKASLNLPGAQPGVYVASITIDGKTQSAKFIK